MFPFVLKNQISSNLGKAIHFQVSLRYKMKNKNPCAALNSPYQFLFFFKSKSNIKFNYLVKSSLLSVKIQKIEA